MKGKRSGSAAREVAYHEVRNLILSREYFPGELISEAGISRKLGMSRTPVREAFRRLQQEGLIHDSNRRKHVSVLDVQEVELIFDLKEVVEGGISRWAAERGAEKDMEALRQLVADMEGLMARKPTEMEAANGWREEWVSWDTRFHALLARMCGNPRATQIVGTLDAPWYKVRMGMTAFTEWIVKSKEEHQGIAEAILRRDAEAAEQNTRAHVRDLKRVILSLMDVFSLTSLPGRT